MNIFKQFKKIHFTFAILLAVLLVVVLAAGCIEENNGLPADKAAVNESQALPVKNQPEQVDPEKAVIEKYRTEINECASKEDEHYRNSCLIEVAKKHKDPSVCELVKVSNPNITIRKSECFGEVGKEMLDKSVCELAADVVIKDKCVLFIAIEKQDISLCKDISDSYYRTEMCEKRITDN